MVSAIDVVAEEEVVREGHVAPDLEQLEQVAELAVDVAADLMMGKISVTGPGIARLSDYGDRSVQLQQGLLEFQNRDSERAELSDLTLLDLLPPLELGKAPVDAEGHRSV